MYTLSGGQIMMVYSMAFLYGFFCQMYWGPALEYANEVVFPVSEAQATGTLLFGGCILSVMSNYIVSSLYGHNADPENYLIFLFISYCVCIVLTNFVSDRLRREEYETFNIYGLGNSFAPVPLIDLLNNSNVKNKTGKKFEL
jgi:hypothetical protein